MASRPWLRYTIYAASLACTAELLQYHFYDWGHMKGYSMHPTLPSHRTAVITSYRHRYGRNCKVGDIVQFRHPYFPKDLAAKRILGMPGDYVVLDKEYAAGVGGAKGPWMGEEDYEKQREEPRMIQVPEGHVWVVGDNLAYSRDSRFFGPLPMGLILGKMVCNIQGWGDWTRLDGDHLFMVPVEEVD